MALYAYEDDLLVHASDAQERLTYRCSGCSDRVRVRKGRFRMPHFYHLSRAPSCRLYSKSEDHLLAQLALQKLLPVGETVLEKPFSIILRVADLIWEPPKIAFEIQCSLLTEHEAVKRMVDYAKVGYRVVWILDDRLFNRRTLKPAEKFVRENPCYFAALRKQGIPTFYDQFETFFQNRRIKKGYRLKVKLDRPRRLPRKEWPEEDFPKQILTKVSNTDLYFYGDLLHKAVLATSIPALSFAMQNFRVLEVLFQKKAERENSLLLRILTKCVFEPFGLLMLNLYEWAEGKRRY